LVDRAQLSLGEADRTSR